MQKQGKQYVTVCKRTGNMRIVPKTNQRRKWQGTLFAHMNPRDNEERTIQQQFKRKMTQEMSLRKQLGLPVARYDAVTRSVYYEYPDGRRERFVET